MNRCQVFQIGRDVQELETREATLQLICSKRDKQKDLIVISNDIWMPDGWREQIESHYDKFDIFGFVMTKMYTNIITNYGFDFVNTDGKLSYTAYGKGDEYTSTLPPRQCDIINGCFMYIKAEVLNEIDFVLDGYNHWAELIFCADAIGKGFKVGCLGHRIYHEGNSSKNTKELNNSTVSYIIERELWAEMVAKYLHAVTPRLVYDTSISNDVLELFNESCLIYGCGTITERLGREFNTLTICSGLPEEIGRVFNGHEVNDINDIDGTKFTHVINTANTIINALSRYKIINLINRGGRIEIRN